MDEWTHVWEVVAARGRARADSPRGGPRQWPGARLPVFATVAALACGGPKLDQDGRGSTTLAEA